MNRKRLLTLAAVLLLLAGMLCLRYLHLDRLRLRDVIACSAGHRPTVTCVVN